MKIVFFVFLLSISSNTVLCQLPEQKLKSAIIRFESDAQMKHGVLSICVKELIGGKLILGKNMEMGLPGASSQKVFTSIAGFELLGSNYIFKTVIGYNGMISSGTLEGNLHVVGSGDPSFGSWRWKTTKSETIFNAIVAALQKAGIKKINGDIILYSDKFSFQPIPDGWIWQDIGNYYGAGAWGINWNENQYDLVLRSGQKEGDSTTIVETKPQIKFGSFSNQIKTGATGSGDNAYIYMAPYSDKAFATGTIPPKESRFVISGSVPDGPLFFGELLTEVFKINKIGFEGKLIHSSDSGNKVRYAVTPANTLIAIASPNYDSLNYWFLRKSVNLYGECFLKTFGAEKEKEGSTDAGLKALRDFWLAQGIDKESLQILDGSGLSPQSRITTHALVKALQYAADRPWYKSFYHALPEYNGMKMKSGSINGSRAFAGYHQSKQGKQYVYAIIASNYSGSSSSIVKKMFEILDELK